MVICKKSSAYADPSSKKILRKIIYAAVACLASQIGTNVQALGLGVQIGNLEANYEIASMDMPWGLLVHEYRSRNRYENSLGPGWCNGLHIKTTGGHVHVNLETNLLIEDQRLVLQDCGTEAQNGMVSEFRALSDAIKSISKRAQEGEQFVLTDVDQSGMTAKVSREGIIISFGVDQAARSFDWNGSLSAVGPVKVTLFDKRITRMQVDEKAVDLQYINNRLINLRAPSGMQANFRYDKDFLVELDNAWLKKYQFSFNENANLESVFYPDKTSYTVFYDEMRDVVTSVLLRNGCTETYSAITTEDKSSYKIQTSLTCKDILQEQKTEAFRFDEKGKPSRPKSNAWERENRTRQ